MEATKDVPEAELDDLEWADAYLFSVPTRFGNVPAQFKQFIDMTGGLWFQGKLTNKAVSAFTSATNTHGGQESTLLSMLLPLLHHGMLYLGLPYSETTLLSTQTGGTPYGPSHLAGTDNNLPLSEDEINLCQALGKRLAETAMAQQDAGLIRVSSA